MNESEQQMVYLGGSIEQRGTARSLVNFYITFKRVRLPKQGRWQISRELAPTEGEVTLSVTNARILSHSSAESIEIEASHELVSSVGEEAGAEVGLKVPGASAKLSQKDTAAQSIKTTMSLRYKQDLLKPVRLDEGRILWSRVISPSEKYLEATDYLWAVSDIPNDTRRELVSFTLRGQVTKFHLVDESGKQVPPKQKWALISFLFKDELDPKYWAPKELHIR